MRLIAISGNARSKAFESIRLAREGNISNAKKLYEEACKELYEAHETQSELIQAEAAGENIPVSLLLIHAQDHLMNALTVKDLANEIILLYEKIRGKDF